MTPSPTDIVRGVYAAFGRGDLPAVLAALADDVSWHCHVPSTVPYSGHFAGRDGVRDFFVKLGGGLRLTSFEPRTFLAHGDTVVVLGHDQGVAVATERALSYDWVHVFTVRNARITSFSEFTETAPLERAFRKE